MKKHLIILLACIIALLTVCVCSPVASAHTTIYPGARYQPNVSYRMSGTITSLNRSVRFQGNYVFSPTYITCRVYRPCFTLINRTGNVVGLVNGYRQFVTKLWPGGVYNQIYYWPGTFYLTDWQRNIHVPLTVTVLGSYLIQPRYTKQMYPMQRGW